MPPEDIGTDPSYEFDPTGLSDEPDEKKSAWMRGFYMIVFFILFSLGQTLLGIITVFQFLALLITGNSNQRLSDFGGTLAIWFADIAAFQTCATDEKPFPWSNWPA